MPIPDQWEFLRTVRRYSVPEIDSVYQKFFITNEDPLIASILTNGVLSISVGNQIVLARSEIM